MLFKIFLTFILLFNTLFANIIGISKINDLNIRDEANINSNIIGTYKHGDIIEISSCDKFSWCKTKDNKYVAKFLIGLIEIEEISTKNKKPKKNYKRKDSKVPVLKDTHCMKLKQIDLSSNEILSLSTQKLMFKKYYNTCINKELLKNILNDLSSFFINESYITTKAYIKAQDINDGQIDITILKGYISDIYHKETKESSGRIKTAFLGQKDELLNLRDLETSLEMVNRVASVDAKFNIIPGKNYGQSFIEIITKQDKSYNFDLGYSSVRKLKDKDPTLTARFSYDNLFNINDILSFNYNGSKVQEKYQGDDAQEINYSFPLSSYLLEFIYSKSDYKRGVEGINETYLSNGETKSKQFRISKILTRNQKHKLKAQISILHKENKNYFSNQLIEVSSYKTSLLQIDLIHSYLSSWGQIHTTYSFYQGKDWFAARADDYFSNEIDYENEAKLEFTKYSLNSNIVYYLKNSTYNFDSTFHLQYTDDSLYSNDKLSVGSAYTVRGYVDSSLYGNNAYYLKNDFIKTFSLNYSKNYLQNLLIFAGLDGGYVRCEDDNKTTCGEIYGQSIGFKTQASIFTSDLTLSKAIKNINKDFNKSTVINMNLNFRF